MPTTDGAAATAVLAALRRSGVDFALLHGAERLHRSGPLSDVDIVVGTPPRRVVAQARKELAAIGLVPVLVWPYDSGGSTTVFITDARARIGVQLDMLHDPDGIGHYRIRSDALVSDHAASDAIPSVLGPDRLVYLWVKRRTKGQVERRRAVEADLDNLTPETVAEAAHRLVTRGDWVTELTGKSTAGTLRRRVPGKRAVLEMGRVASRVAAPIGFWAHLPSSHGEVAAEVAARFARVLVRATAPRSPDRPLAWPWYATQVVPVRLRPGLVISHGRRPRGLPAPDLIVAAGPVDADEIAARVVREMSERIVP